MTPKGLTTVPKTDRGWLRLRNPVLLFLVAVVLRVIVLSVLVAHSRVWWGINEAGTIGDALIHGRGFATPFHDATGPTAWFAPVYPGIIAAAFLLFGVRTTASAWAAALLNVLFASLTALTIRQVGREHFDEASGDLAGWAWAVSPPMLIMPWLLWETCLSGLVMSLVFLQFLRLNEHSRPWRWVLCGCTWSLAGLVNPALLAPLPALGLCAAFRRCTRGFVAMLLVCFLGILPWTVRNELNFHHFVPVRSNLWPELYFANAGFALHPHGNSMVYQREGEAAFAADMETRFIDYAHSHSADFIRLTARRMIEFWIEPLNFGPCAAFLSLATFTGLFRARFAHREWTSFASVLALYPVLYYFTFTFSRFRYPIEPFMYVLAGFAISPLIIYGRSLFSASEGT